MTDDEREALVERMAIRIAGLAWVGATSAQRAVWRANAKDALSVAEPVVRADEREVIANLPVDPPRGADATDALIAYREAIERLNMVRISAALEARNDDQ